MDGLYVRGGDLALGGMVAFCVVLIPARLLTPQRCQECSAVLTVKLAEEEWTNEDARLATSSQISLKGTLHILNQLLMVQMSVLMHVCMHLSLPMVWSSHLVMLCSSRFALGCPGVTNNQKHS